MPTHVMRDYRCSCLQGTRGLSLFYLETKNELDGRLNNFEIQVCTCIVRSETLGFSCTYSITRKKYVCMGVVGRKNSKTYL